MNVDILKMDRFVSIKMFLLKIMFYVSIYFCHFIHICKDTALWLFAFQSSQTYGYKFKFTWLYLPTPLIMNSVG